AAFGKVIIVKRLKESDSTQIQMNTKPLKITRSLRKRSKFAMPEPA
ncbi:510_t:CDS:1, partial [Funneliformis geosporum]